MTPDRRKKLFALQFNSATTENEIEICKNILGRHPCEICGGLRFYRKTGKCEACATQGRVNNLFKKKQGTHGRRGRTVPCPNPGVKIEFDVEFNEIKITFDTELKEMARRAAEQAAWQNLADFLGRGP